MKNLYSSNSPACFWRPLAEPEVSAFEWDEAVRAAAPVLPEATCAQGTDADSLIHAVLGEGQFGPHHWRLSAPKRLYYVLRPVLPRSAVLILRRLYRFNQQDGFRLGWPIEDRYVRFQFQVVQNMMAQRGMTRLPFIHFWPNGSQFVLVLTHDVETEQGQSFVRDLAALEEQQGFRSSFNFVPEGYPLDRALMAELRERGFEVGVHGLKHDGKLFSSRVTFERRATRINRVLQNLNAVGYRSPLTHRNPEWMQALNIEYDLSFFDTDPYETMPGGTMSIWPFFMGRFVELPYTLAQDHTLMVILGEESPRLWLEKVAFIEQYSGMVLVNVHPDYMCDQKHLAIYEEFLRTMRARGGYWHALPRDVARWWRARAEAKAERRDGKWIVPDLPGATIGRIGLSEHGIEITM